MSDSAKGPLAGYLFQFEKALLLLANLESSDDFVSIEKIDDVAAHDEYGTVITTIQAKHSIASSGTTFEDTSYALWRTFEIWIKKIESKTLNSNTQFICATNKTIDRTKLLYKIVNNEFDSVFFEIESLRDLQATKFNEFQERDREAGKSIAKVLKLLDFVLSKKDIFKIVKDKLSIEDEEKTVDKFFSKLHLTSVRVTSTQKDSIYHAFYGWIAKGSLAKWQNDEDALFSKKAFDEKFIDILRNPAIVYAVFRTKASLGSIDESQIEKHKQELFVRQLSELEINKQGKERRIKDAILDVIYSEIELKYIVERGNYTSYDFEEFLDDCFQVWQRCFDEHFIKENTQYTESEKHETAIRLYDFIMRGVNLNFKEGISFSIGNQYIRNGSFLKLSSIPRVGWHPEWITKYKQ